MVETIRRPSFLGPLPFLSDREDAMNHLSLKVRHFLVSDDGPTAVEYAVMLALIVLVCIAAIRSIGTTASATFDTMANGF